MFRQSGKARPKTSRSNSKRNAIKKSKPNKPRQMREPKALRDLGTGSIQTEGVAASYSTYIRSGEPRIRRTAKACNIAHRELISASVAGSTTFTVQNSFSLNPGLAAVFPWLAPQAQQWEQYCCNYLCFEWIPIAQTGTQGDVMLSPDYDPSDPTPTLETQLSDNVGTVVDSCWKRINVELDFKAMMALGPRKYVRPCLVAGDPKTFDVGKFFLATNNETGTSAIGKLFVCYDFDFFVPQNSPSPATTPQQTSVYTRATAQTFTTAVAAPLQFDAATYDPIGIGAPATGVFTPPAGCYRVEFGCSFADSAAEAFQVLVSLYKNGAALSKPVQAYLNVGVSLGAAETVPISLYGVVPMNGTDTLQIQVDMVGAGGTLTSYAASASLLLSLA